MISVIAGTNHYILQAGLVEKHKKTLDWLSQTVLWKTELQVFQNIIEAGAPSAHRVDDKKQLDHFQNLIIYYNGEVIDEMRKKLRAHENKLARMLEKNAEWDVAYYREHDTLMADAQSIGDRFGEIKNELVAWKKTLKDCTCENLSCENRRCKTDTAENDVE